MTSATSAIIECEALADGIDYSFQLSWAKFEELNIDLFKKCIQPIEDVLKDAGLSKY